MLLYLTLASCAVLAGLLVYRYDLYDREPWYMAVTAVALGTAAMLALGEIETWTITHVVGSTTPTALALVAACEEELARLAIVLGLALTARRHFNDPIDGLVYGSLVGLGMALTESIAVVREWPELPTSIPPSEIVRILGHLVLGGITGYPVGPIRMHIHGWGRWLAGCLSFTLTWHFAWDWIAFTASARGSMDVQDTIGGIALMLAGLFFYGALVVRGSLESRGAMAPRSAKSVWGWPLTILRRR